MEIFCCKCITDELILQFLFSPVSHTFKQLWVFLVIVAVGVSKGAGILGLVQHSVSHTQRRQRHWTTHKTKRKQTTQDTFGRLSLTAGEEHKPLQNVFWGVHEQRSQLQARFRLFGIHHQLVEIFLFIYIYIKICFESGTKISKTSHTEALLPTPLCTVNSQ